MRLLVTGDRRWTDRSLVRSTLLMYAHEARRRGEVLVVIEGEADGADTIAKEEAIDLGIPVERYEADWRVTPETPEWAIRRRRDGSLYDVRAGPKRNQRMLDDGRPTHAAAFHVDLRKSKGTADMVRRIERARLPLRVVPRDTRSNQLTMEG